MRPGTIQRESLVASLVLATAAIIGGDLAGQMLLGTEFGVGLALGSLNGFTIQAMLDRGAPILATSFLRLFLLSLLALAAAFLLGGSVWSVVLGIGAAQLVMVGVGVRQGRRA